MNLPDWPLLAVLVPVLGRPHRAAPLVEAFKAATPHPHDLVFVAEPDDREEIDAIERVQDAGNRHVGLTREPGSYAHKINVACGQTRAPLLFLAADDLVPQPGWLEAAYDAMVGGVEVVGVNDLIDRRPERRGHATHFLVTRAYAQRPTIDGRCGPLSEEFDHSFCDDELIGTASKRGVYAYAEHAHVRHDHPMSGAPDDETYRKGRAQFHADRKLFMQRRRLWA